MHLDILSLAFCASLVFSVEAAAFHAHYVFNRPYEGMRRWLWGMILQALGFLAMATLAIPSLRPLASLANPLIILGQLCLYFGISAFLGREGISWLAVSAYLVFLLFYLFFGIARPNLLIRSLLVDSSSALFAIAGAASLLSGETRRFSASANFLASAFLAYGLFQLAVGAVTLRLEAYATHADLAGASASWVVFVVPIAASILWTFGFAMMVNQRLDSKTREEREKLRLVFDSSPDGTLITRLDDGSFAGVNDGFLRLSGFGREELIGKSILDKGVWVDPADRLAYVAELREKGRVDGRECLFRRKDGSAFVAILSGGLLAVDGQEHIVSVMHDITDRKLAEGRIQELARQLEIERDAAEARAVTDSLTGLANRRRFDERLSSEISRLGRSGLPLSLIMMDIDLFKSFNDTYGHIAGDECLRRVGAALRETVGRVQDTAARYGGEEFAVVMPETDAGGAAALAERIRAAVEGLGIPHAASSVEPFVTVSLGVATVDPARLPDPEAIVALADGALYESKNGGRNRISIASAGIRVYNRGQEA